MKKKHLLSFVFVLLLASLTTTIGQVQKVPSSYDRSAITVMVLDFRGGLHAAELAAQSQAINFTQKFFNNNLSSLLMPAPFNRTDITSDKSELIKQSLVQNKVPNGIIATWYAMNSDGMMSQDLIHERGMFNATDDAFLKSKTTKRGNAELEEYGNRLINRSYILILDYTNLYTMEELKQPSYRGWKSTVNGYLFKLNYSQEVQNKLYEAWIYEDDSPAVKAEKKQKFSQLEVPLDFVTMTTVNIDASQQKERNSTIKMLIPDKSPEELFAELVQKGYDENLYSLEKKVEDFKVKTNLTNVHPLQAKIGTKEGILTDYRFFAFENVLNENTNVTKQKMRGVIRATSKIVDNNKVTTGSSGTTEFYQTAGRKLETGYLLQQRNETGVEVSLGFASGEIGGLTGRADYRLGRFIGVPALFAYVAGGVQAQTYDESEYAFLRYEAGLAKGLQLSRNMELRPYAGYGYEKTTYGDAGIISTNYMTVGTNLSLNITHNAQLWGGAGYTMFIGNVKAEDDSEYNATWNDLFTNRGGVTVAFGLKVGF